LAECARVDLARDDAPALRPVKPGALSLVTNRARIGMGCGIRGIINGEIGMALYVIRA
jgi:hypothetical protein